MQKMEHKKPKLTRRRVSCVADLLIQREPVRWHCAARREIAERSEEAPAAKAAQPSRNAGRWKTPGGVLRGGCKGGREGGAAP